MTGPRGVRRDVLVYAVGRLRRIGEDEDGRWRLIPILGEAT